MPVRTLRISRHLPHVLFAVALLLAGSATLALRLQQPAHAPEARVPAPRRADLAALAAPCWSCREAQSWPLASRVDLDLLAPLGDGDGNLGEWLVQFTEGHGRRAAEVAAIEARRVEGPADLGMVLPADDPILAELEPWADQARFSLYPDLLPIQGLETPIPPLTLPLLVAKSWIARGRAEDDPDAALADYRRAVRLGRLLRSEDVTLISDFVGLACIRLGASAIYDQARRQGDAEQALVASVVLGEIAPQRLLSGSRIAEMLVEQQNPDGTVTLHPDHLRAALEAARTAPERRLRNEAILQLATAAQHGESAQKEEARKALAALSEDPDRIVAAVAKTALGEG